MSAKYKKSASNREKQNQLQQQQLLERNNELMSARTIGRKILMKH
jgi:hypothetical protein